MLIRSVNFTAHPILGELRLDFVDPQTGRAVENIVLAGENGSGKSVILNEIFSVLGDADERGSELEMLVEVGEGDLAALIAKLDASELKTGLVRIRRGGTGAPIEVELLNETGAIRRRPDELLKGKCRPIRAFLNGTDWATTPLLRPGETGEGEPVGARKAGPDLAREIGQLIVEAANEDAREIADHVRANPQSIVPPEFIDRRIKRFADAVAWMFPTKRYNGIARGDGRYQPLFEEHGRISSLDQLSAGERQILLRAGFIIRDLAGITGAVLLIDEPEAGLHPVWQSRILPFYRHLLTSDPGVTTQIIAATHSPYLVHEASVRSKVVCLSKDPSGKIAVDAVPAYPTTGEAQLVQILKAEPLIFRSRKPMVVIVEGETDACILQAAWKRLRPDIPTFFEIDVAYGRTGIRTRLNREELFASNPGKMIVGLFDFDAAYADWMDLWGEKREITETDVRKCLTVKCSKQKGWGMMLPVPDYRSDIASIQFGADSALAIELLFKDADIPKHVQQKRWSAKINAYVPKVVGKNEIASLSKTLEAPSFRSFLPIFEKLEQIREEVKSSRA